MDKQPPKKKSTPKNKSTNTSKNAGKGFSDAIPKIDFQGKKKKAYSPKPKAFEAFWKDKQPGHIENLIKEGKLQRNPKRANHKDFVPPKEAEIEAPKPRRKSEEEELVRLNKYVAHCGVAARRQAAEFVKKGLIKVNGEVELNPSYFVKPTDIVEYKGKTIRQEVQKIYILLNKPKDVITTSNDEKGRKTVLDIVGRKIRERIFPVGRLDRMTSGLLLLTNDGELAKKLTHPSHKVSKFYHVILDKPLPKPDLERIQKGLELEDGLATVDAIDYVGAKKDELGIELHSGKNRIIRRIFEHLGFEVTKLDRTYYAGLNKKELPRGHFRHLSEREVVMLKHFK